MPASIAAAITARDSAMSKPAGASGQSAKSESRTRAYGAKRTSFTLVRCSYGIESSFLCLDAYGKGVLKSAQVTRVARVARLMRFARIARAVASRYFIAQKAPAAKSVDTSAFKRAVGK